MTTNSMGQMWYVVLRTYVFFPTFPSHCKFKFLSILRFSGLLRGLHSTLGSYYQDSRASTAGSILRSCHQYTRKLLWQIVAKFLDIKPLQFLHQTQQNAPVLASRKKLSTQRHENFQAVSVVFKVNVIAEVFSDLKKS